MLTSERLIQVGVLSRYDYTHIPYFELRQLKIGDSASFCLYKFGDFANFAANKNGDFADGYI